MSRGCHVRGRSRSVAMVQSRLASSLTAMDGETETYPSVYRIALSLVSLGDSDGGDVYAQFLAMLRLIEDNGRARSVTCGVGRDPAVDPSSSEEETAVAASPHWG